MFSVDGLTRVLTSVRTKDYIFLQKGLRVAPQHATAAYWNFLDDDAGLKTDASLEWRKSGNRPAVIRSGRREQGGQDRSERGQMAEAVLGGVEEEYLVAPCCIGMRLVRQVSK